ncbi:MAG: Lrp/AsnC family transcriptional regulator [Rhizobacter sp.]|nr:Lrp/AsnC family transcriptional regulator [Chlorobiales bacterium]
MSAYLDKTDLKLIELLSERGRMRRNELAEAVGLSIPSVSERLDKLQTRDVITGYTVTVDEKKLGYDIIAFIRITTESSKHYTSLVSHLKSEDEILECFSITGEGSHLVKAMTCNTASLEKLLARIQSWPGVSGTQTSIVLSELKKSNRINGQKTLKQLESKDA